MSAEHQLKLKEYAATTSAAQLAADRDKLRRGMQAVWDAQSDQDWDASADALGYPDLKGKFSQKRAILRSLMDQDEFLDSIAPPVPLSPQGKFESDKSKGFVPPDAVYQSGGNTTVTVGGGSDLRKELSKEEGKQWASAMDAGSRAGALSQDLEMMTELSAVAPQGPVVGRFAEAFPGVNSAADAFNSVVKRVAPTLREPGSGSTSDIEYDGMLKSLPALRNKPEANAAIIGMMQAKQQIMVEKAAAVAAFQQGEASEQQTRQRLQELNSQSIMTPQLRALIGATGSQSDEAVPEGVDPSDWEYMNPEERALFQ
ncbi:hypothetical protein LO749_12050 [Paracoccus denitrificans]|uniref:hypothetical protein n=1 Tax=Paracoccus denitrificans TaxID=266 RepID=UPI001E402EF4|nr:hypothetical protein [Paracoccus denitrificans]UFS64866.1 hypothetical protein LO749_12050 [Paracoccus denitrificans]